MLPPSEGNAEESRILGEPFEPVVVRIQRGLEPALGESLSGTIDQRLGSEFLREPLQLTEGGRPLLEINEMYADPALREEAERLASIGILFCAEDLDFQAGDAWVVVGGERLAIGETRRSKDAWRGTRAVTLRRGGGGSSCAELGRHHLEVESFLTDAEIVVEQCEDHGGERVDEQMHDVGGEVGKRRA